MKDQKKPAVSGADPSGATAAHPQGSVVLHRVWLIALAALIIIPWLIAGVTYFWRSDHADAPAPLALTVEAPSGSVAPGPWGQLSTTPIVISPPLEYVTADLGMEGDRLEWFFPGASAEVMEAVLATAGLSPEQIRNLRAAARPEPRIKGFIVTPDPAMVRNLSRETRGRLYLELGKTPLNFDHAHAFRFHGSSTQAWLGGSSISPQTKELVEPLIYRDGDSLLFADMKIIRAQIKDEKEVQRLKKVLLRQSTVIIKLSVTNESDIPGLAEYWGRGGRRTDLRPLLESVAGQGTDHSIDVIHVLPTFARNHLYRYPRQTWSDFDKPLLSNCLWSALNFFNPSPDDRFLDVNVALNTLRRDYYIVEHDFQLGDVVGFFDSSGNLFHVASYLADDLVLSKNGFTPMAPWAITTIDQLKNYYRLTSANPQVIYHRRKDM